MESCTTFMPDGSVPTRTSSTNEATAKATTTSTRLNAVFRLGAAKSICSLLYMINRVIALKNVLLAKVISGRDVSWIGLPLLSVFQRLRVVGNVSYHHRK